MEAPEEGNRSRVWEEKYPSPIPTGKPDPNHRITQNLQDAIYAPKSSTDEYYFKLVIPDSLGRVIEF
jgi:hypothetical protein